MLYWSRELTFKLFNLVHQYYAIKFGALDKKNQLGSRVSRQG
ncbi:hypothetical protein TSAR_002683 [Trichomalopsis sarcophagae]|uniref:Uncharacterized protein n=1 Tax=Trichomalopsis sarcophagae TaxID=543379 RepID=A0A232EPX1_9HYME|nr:hypothetical protein TSAR_002683 [Trichomalopsis sarcophagae]